MRPITLKSAEHVIPMIYAYTTPEIHRHDGWTKIGYTEQDVKARLEQQTHTADVICKLEWKGNAIFEDGSGETFKDTQFHAYLRKQGIDNDRKNEWFHVNGPESHQHFFLFRMNRGVLESIEAALPYNLRAEQKRAIERTLDYYRCHEEGEFLWNAKPRFGKTLVAYDFCKQMDARNVLILTNRPAIANSWYADYEKFFGPDSGYLFVSNTDTLKGKKYVLSRDAYLKCCSELADDETFKGCIEFVSLQDLKGSTHFGGEFKKLDEVCNIKWDVLLLDEAHEGVDTIKTEIALNQITHKFTLHLSGTPFKAIANEKFKEDAIYNWTYADEQKAKANWTPADGEENPYETLPQLNLYTYQMSEIIKDELRQGIEIEGATEEYAFDLNEFFETKNGVFVHDSSVDRFLDALTTLTKFPFSTDELRNELKHTFWLLNRVESAKAIAKKLEAHPVFGQYEIVLAAGDGKLSEDDESAKSFDKVKAAIAKSPKTITLSVGQLTTGVTIPEWTAVLMLSNMKSPAQYMQAAFRAQNPCLFAGKDGYYRKENAYVFDFDPARTLIIFEEFANDLTADTSDGRGDVEKRKEHIRELLNFFPVIGEDESGEMVELDAAKVLSIPRKIKSQEVVKRGFMSNFLFQNVSNVFSAPKEVMDIIGNIESVQEPKKKTEITPDTGKELSLDDNGNVALTDEFVQEKAEDLFGPKIFDTAADDFETALDTVTKTPDAEKKPNLLETLKQQFHEKAVAPIVQTAQTEYAADLKTAAKKKIEQTLTAKADHMIDQAYGDYSIKQKELEAEHTKKLAAAPVHERAAITQEYEQKKQEAVEELKQTLVTSVETFVHTASEDVVKTVETAKRDELKSSAEETVKSHLRGFSRTIPSFLMAYGTDTVTLDTFDTIIPDAVFKEVTSITLEQFRFLRDGGEYVEQETDETKWFGGHLFDPIVFNDSVREFLAIKVKLANYFNVAQKEDIFDYIPPQKNNQIFTPKWVVSKMVDMLEQENPGCYDDPDKTFIDMYMKSGLYISEIVKRLYQSEKMKQRFPDSGERLRHIFEKQVYGLAPTEIIYKIATSFILGFDDGVVIPNNNFRQVDALAYVKEGTLEDKLKEIYPEMK